MSELESILSFNRQFVDSGEYEKFFTDKYPERGLAILSCMDARMMELLPRALGLKNGDAKLIKNAGAVVSHPWGSVMRSLLVAVFELKVREIMVIAHHDCGMQGLHAESFLNKVHDSDIPDDRIETLRHAGISVRHTVRLIRNHPLMPADIAVHGLVIHPTTGKLNMVVDGTLAQANLSDGL